MVPRSRSQLVTDWAPTGRVLRRRRWYRELPPPDLLLQRQQAAGEGTELRGFRKRPRDNLVERGAKMDIGSRPLGATASQPRSLRAGMIAVVPRSRGFLVVQPTHNRQPIAARLQRLEDRVYLQFAFCRLRPDLHIH